MRFQFLALLLMTIAAAGTFWYRSTAAMCPVPLSYRIGTISPEFNLREEQVQQYLQSAEGVWESSTGKDLFFYDQKGTVVVNFIFDERQAEADAQATQKAALDAKKTENQKNLDALKELETEYETRRKAYQTALAAYEERLTSYNNRVNQYNDQGGAPEKEYTRLEAEKRSLDRESSSINETTETLNKLAATLNELSQKSSVLIDQYNAEVEAYNKQFGFSREFTEGDYQNGIINIYKYSSDAEVVRVLAHELGHALGIDHVEGESSVMYYLISDTVESLRLSSEDMNAYALECETEDERLVAVRRLIREFVNNFNI